MQFFIYTCLMVLYVAVTTATPVTTKDSNKLAVVKETLAIDNRVVQIYDTLNCVEKFICTLAALPEPMFNQHLNNPLSIFVKIATDTNNDNERPLYLEARRLLTGYAKFEELLLAAEIGNSMTDDDKCSEQYPECPLDRREIIAMVNDYGKMTNLSADNPLRDVFTNLLAGDHTSFPSQDRRVKRACSSEVSTGCGVAGGACIAAAATCAVCGFFTFGLCGAACAAPTAGACFATKVGCKVGGC